MWVWDAMKRALDTSVYKIKMKEAFSGFFESFAMWPDFRVALTKSPGAYFFAAYYAGIQSWLHDFIQQIKSSLSLLKPFPPAASTILGLHATVPDQLNGPISQCYLQHFKKGNIFEKIYDFKPKKTPFWPFLFEK